MLQSQRTKVTQLIASRLLTDGQTASATHDCSGCKSVEVIVNISTEETTDATTMSIALQEGDTTDASNLATVFANQTVANETARNIVYRFQPRKKLIKLSVTSGTGTGSDSKIGAIVREERLLQEPENTTDQVGSSNDVCLIR